jgi:hypothetical protein
MDPQDTLTDTDHYDNCCRVRIIMIDDMSSAHPATHRSSAARISRRHAAGFDGAGMM